MEPTTEEKAMYSAIYEKMGETVYLPPDKLHLSEYNTRSTCIDLKHVDYLAERIRERGFHPKRAISVNVIRGAGGSETAYRVAAGVHRLEASKKLGLINLPCLLFYNLTEEEECLLDKWDNEMDEDHKPIPFLNEAEHYKYLNEIKGWSQNKIARNKNIARGKVQWRLQIANLPEEAKMIVRGVDHGLHLFSERHFRDICELSEPHIIAICEEIATRGRQAEAGEKDLAGNPVTPMKQADIKKRVDELLELAKEAEKLSGTPETPSLHLNLSENVQPGNKQPDMSCTEKAVLTEHEEVPEEPLTSQAPEHVIEKEQIRDLAYRSPEKNSRGLNLDRCVRWLKNSGLVRELGQTAYIVLRKMEEYDLWYRANQDEPFFFGPDKEPFAHIADQAGIEKEHLQKRSLPYLKKEGFLDYWLDKGLYWFKLNWDKLFEIYLARAHTIPFDEDGLRDIPPGFSGVIRPTPFHYLKIEKGMVVPWNGTSLKSVDIVYTAKENEQDPLAQELRCLKPPMGEKEILFCLTRRPETETALKLMHEMKPENRKTLRSEAAYLFDVVRRGPIVPQGFVTPPGSPGQRRGSASTRSLSQSLSREKVYEVLSERTGRL